MASDDKTILEISDDGVACITLNDPDKRNAIGQEMVDSMHRNLDELARRDDVGALVVTGAGDKAFAAGADIAQLRDRRAPQALAAINSALFKRLEDFPVPSIAAIRGWALGGGCELAIACDLRVVGTSARMGQPEVGLGIIPAAGGTYRLPRLIGLGLARELVYTGRILDADECVRIGLANRIVADEQVLESAYELARQIARNGRLAVQMAKRTMNAIARANEGLAVTMESTSQALLFDSQDKIDRMTAFLERKKK
jgi:enoyl-CoA hydratase